MGDTFGAFASGLVGEQVVIAQTNQFAITGELLEVRRDCLILLASESQRETAVMFAQVVHLRAK
jgi:hypothetical protein